MKINVHAGHTKQSGKSPGAQGYIKESIEDRKIKNEVIKLLKKKGHTVYDCTSEGYSANNNLVRIVDKCNAHSVALDISIHINCYNHKADGCEVEIYNQKSKAKKYAKRVVANMAKLGFDNRGVKSMPYLYVIKHTNAPCMLVECFFCDNKKDVNTYKKVGYKKVAKAIVDAVK